MAIEKTDVVDAVGIEIESGDVVLTIADSRDWSELESHLLALQQKLNAYFEFIESGQIRSSFPEAQGKRLRIDVVFRFEPPAVVLEFLGKAADVASELETRISHRVIPDSETTSSQRA